MLERCKEIGIHVLLIFADLIFEHLALNDWVVLFGICRGNFLAVDAEFEDVDRAVVVLSDLGQWAKFTRDVRDEGRLDERWLDQLFKDIVSDFVIL